MAWLDTTPEGAKTNRRATYKGSALAALQPEDYYRWIIDLSLECGLSIATGFGMQTISWGEILSWQQATDNKGLWIAKVMHSLSAAYTNELIAAKSLTRPSPISYLVDEQEQRKAVAEQFKLFKGG